MSKVITRINQLDEGGINPKSNVHEDKLWELHFDDDDSRILGRTKVLEYLTKGTVPSKTAHSFKLWSVKTTLGNTIRTWVIVYDDHSHVQVINKDFYAILANGHRNKDEEKKESTSTKELADEYLDPDVGEVVESQRGAISKAIQQAQEESNTDRITSQEDRVEVDAFRNKVVKDRKYEDFRDLIKKDALLHKDAKGYVDKK